MQATLIILGLLIVAGENFEEHIRRKHKHRRFIHSRFRFNDDLRNKHTNLRQSNVGNVKEADTVNEQKAMFIPKDDNFILKCPKSADNHWNNKINFTVDWSLDGLRYLTILRRNLFPKLEFINHYAKLLKQNKRRNGRFKFPYLSIQQWPNIDGKSASAIVYLNPNNEDEKPISQEGINAGQYYKFEAEERRQWFVLRIPQPKSRRDQGMWECRMTIYVRNGDEDPSDIQVVRLESRKVLTGPNRQQHIKPYVEFKKSSRRKTRMNGEENLDNAETIQREIENLHLDDSIIDENEQFTFAQNKDKSLIISRGNAPKEVQFSRNDGDVQFTRGDFYSYHKTDDEVNLPDENLDLQPEKILMLPTADGLLWSRWFSRNDDYQNVNRKYWWQNADEYNAASTTISNGFWICCLAFIEIRLALHYQFV